MDSLPFEEDQCMQSLCLEGYLCLLDLDVDQALGGRKLDRVLLERGLLGDRALQLLNKSSQEDNLLTSEVNMKMTSKNSIRYEKLLSKCYASHGA